MAQKQNGHQKWNYKLVTPSENVLTNAPWLKSEHRQVQPIRAMTGETEARPRRPKLRGRESWFQTDAAGCWGRAETETGKNCLEARQLPRGLHHCGIPTISGAARVGRGKASPYGWTPKNYVICVCFHCHGTSSYNTTNTLQGRRAKSHVDTQTIQTGLGDFVL